MKKLYLLFAVFVFVIGASACESQNSDDENDNNDDNDQDENVDNGDNDNQTGDVDQETLDGISDILVSLESSYEDWEGKRLVNNVEMQDPEDESKRIDVETRILIDENTDRVYAETYDETDEDQPVLMNYLYFEDGTVYTYENAESKPDDNEDTYRKQDESDREADLPDIDGMFKETLQFFPADHDTAEMQGFQIQDASLDYDEDAEDYQADVEVLMQTSSEEEKDEVWSIEGDMDEVTIAMPLPTMGTVTFEEFSQEDFDKAIESVDTSQHSEEESSQDSE